MHKSEAEFSIVTAFKAAQKTYFFPSSCPFSRNERRTFRLEKKKKKEKKRLATTVSTQPKKRIYRCVHTHRFWHCYQPYQIYVIAVQTERQRSFSLFLVNFPRSQTSFVQPAPFQPFLLGHFRSSCIFLSLESFLNFGER